MLIGSQEMTKRLLPDFQLDLSLCSDIFKGSERERLMNSHFRYLCIYVSLIHILGFCVQCQTSYICLFITSSSLCILVIPYVLKVGSFVRTKKTNKNTCFIFIGDRISILFFLALLYVDVTKLTLDSTF